MVSKLSAAVFFALLFCTSYIILRWDVFKLRISDLFTEKKTIVMVCVIARNTCQGWEGQLWYFYELWGKTGLF